MTDDRWPDERRARKGDGTMSQGNPPGAPTTPDQAGGDAPISFEPQVRGESLYDQVTSGLMAVVAGAVMVFGWLSLIYATTQAYASGEPTEVRIIEVSGGGGGDPEG